MRWTLLLPMAMLLASCASTQEPPTSEQPAATYDTTYDQKCEEALEYFVIQQEQGPFLDDLLYRGSSISEGEKKALRRVNYLQDAIWRWEMDESPDVVVKEQDQEDIDRIIDEHLAHPSPGAWEDAPTSRDKCTEIVTHFFNGNRCSVCIVFYDHGPLAAAGTSLYLFKYKGQWTVVSWNYWIT